MKHFVGFGLFTGFVDNNKNTEERQTRRPPFIHRNYYSTNRNTDHLHEALLASRSARIRSGFKIKVYICDVFLQI